MRFPAFVCALCCFAISLHATTVRPPTFDELVGDAELAFRGRVTEVRADWAGPSDRRYIATFVTFAIERTLKGEAGDTLTLQFMGGEVGGERLRLAGWPEFQLGDHGIFFVENRQGRACPLVRLRHGRYRIVTDAGTGLEHVLRDDFTPLRSAAMVVQPLTDNASLPRGSLASLTLSLSDFEGQILQRTLQPVPTQPGGANR